MLESSNNSVTSDDEEDYDDARRPSKIARNSLNGRFSSTESQGSSQSSSTTFSSSDSQPGIQGSYLSKSFKSLTRILQDDNALEESSSEDEIDGGENIDEQDEEVEELCEVDGGERELNQSVDEQDESDFEGGEADVDTTSIQQRSEYEPMDEVAQNHEVENEEEIYQQRVVSPGSSSGSSLSSMEYLFRKSEKINDECKEFHAALSTLVPSLQINDLLLKYVRHPSFKLRFLDFVKNDVRSFLLSSGQELESSESVELMHYLSSGSDNTVLARIGRSFIQDFMESKPMSENQGYESAIVETSSPLGISSNQGEQREELAMTRSIQSLDRKFDAPPPPTTSVETLLDKDEKSCPSVPEYRACTEENMVVDGFASCSTSKQSRDGLIKKRIPTEVLDAAFDYVNDEKPIERMGQVLFDFIFTSEEIKNSRCRKNRENPAFDKEKVRLLNQTLAWFQTKPSDITQEAHEEHIKINSTLRLGQSDEKTMKKQILIEYAYRQRNDQDGKKKKKKE